MHRCKGAQRLRAELEELKSVKRPAVIHGDRRGARARRPQGERRVPRRARAAGLHRRPHQAARGRAVARAGHRRDHAQRRLARWCSAPPSTLADVETDEEKTYQIVGDLEADIKQGLIAISSPVARALIGKHEGDTITIDAPAGTARVRDRRRPLRRLTCRCARDGHAAAARAQRVSPASALPPALARGARSRRPLPDGEPARRAQLPRHFDLLPRGWPVAALTRQRRRRRCRRRGVAARRSGLRRGRTSTAHG